MNHLALLLNPRRCRHQRRREKKRERKKGERKKKRNISLMCSHLWPARPHYRRGRREKGNKKKKGRITITVCVRPRFSWRDTRAKGGKKERREGGRGRGSSSHPHLKPGWEKGKKGIASSPNSARRHEMLDSSRQTSDG